MAWINILPTRNGLGPAQLDVGLVSLKKGWEICDILQTALPFAPSNKINLFPGVVQLVVMGSLIYKLFQSLV